MLRVLQTAAALLALHGFQGAHAGGLSKEDLDQCTAIVVERHGTDDGSSMATHTNDCLNCDFRLAYVPAADHKKGSKRNVYTIKGNYPRYVGYERGDLYTPEHLEKGPAHWPQSVPEGTMEQVQHTYAYAEASFPIMNEHQLVMGESTCSGKLIDAQPISAGGKALFEMNDLTRVALERCKTARCAVKLMGELAEEHGYYSSEYTGPIAGRLGEAGEGMTVSDPNEAWVFHILPDDTGESAVWAAQRLEEGHISVIANEFVIKEIDPEGSPERFMASKNVFTVAKRNGFWDPKKDGAFSFQKAYSVDPGAGRYAARRVWRVFSLAAPEFAQANLDPNASIYDLPFSVKVEGKVSAADLMRYQRDHYEGTQFDQTRGMQAGPWGNPNRYDGGTQLDGIKTLGHFERSISIFRTSYSYVAKSRAWLPDCLGGMFYFAHYAPASSVYVPFYLTDVAESYKTGSLYRFNRDSSWWAFASIGNWADRMYKYIIAEVTMLARQIEGEQFTHIAKLEQRALDMMKPTPHNNKNNKNNNNHTAIDARTLQSVRKHLAQATQTNAERVVGQAWQMFEFLMTKYHDGYIFEDLRAQSLSPTPMYFPLWWLEEVGFFNQSVLATLVHNQTHGLEPAYSAYHNGPTLKNPAYYKDVDVSTGLPFRSEQLATMLLAQAEPKVVPPSPPEGQAAVHGGLTVWSQLLIAGAIAVAFVGGVWVGGRNSKRNDYRSLDD